MADVKSLKSTSYLSAAVVGCAVIIARDLSFTLCDTPPVLCLLVIFYWSYLHEEIKASKCLFEVSSLCNPLPALKWKSFIVLVAHSCEGMPAEACMPHPAHGCLFFIHFIPQILT